MLRDDFNVQLGPLLVSDNDVYVIREKEKSALYVKVGTDEPYYCLSSGLGRHITYKG